MLSKTFGSVGDTSGPWITFAEANEMKLGHRGLDMFTVKATVNMIRVENALYKSCPNDTCKKKVIVISVL